MMQPPPGAFSGITGQITTNRDGRALRFSKTHMKTITEKEAAALEVLNSTGSDVLEKALVAKEALGQCRGRVGRVRQ